MQINITLAGWRKFHLNGCFHIDQYSMHAWWKMDYFACYTVPPLDRTSICGRKFLYLYIKQNDRIKQNIYVNEIQSILEQYKVNISPYFKHPNKQKYCFFFKFRNLMSTTRSNTYTPWLDFSLNSSSCLQKSRQQGQLQIFRYFKLALTLRLIMNFQQFWIGLNIKG